MIVKLIIHKNDQEISIWNENGDRLYYSDQEADVKEALRLKAMPGYTGYFNAYWKKKIVQLDKFAKGYSW